jgi:hypothetical protein
LAVPTDRRVSAVSSLAKKRTWWLWAILALVLLGSGLFAWVRSGNDSPQGPLAAVRNAPNFQHIHGLGLNHADDSLYAATHGGLYRIRNGKASIVANRYQDTMGFTIVGPDHFLGSGHPDLREDLPPLLGLLETRDAGETWDRKSLLGEADFHALRYAHETIWGYDSTSGRLMVSKDGEDWDVRSSVALRDFEISPDSSNLVIGSNGKALTQSKDGGRTWAPIDSPDSPLLLSWHERRELWLLTGEGVAYRTTDSGQSWDERGQFPGEPQAFVVEGDFLYAATHNEIFISKDEGNTWHLFFSETGESDERKTD